MLITLRPSDFYVPDRSMQLRVGLSIDRYEIKCANQPIEIGGCWPRKVTSSVSCVSSMCCILDRSGCSWKEFVNVNMTSRGSQVILFVHGTDTREKEVAEFLSHLSIIPS